MNSLDSLIVYVHVFIVWSWLIKDWWSNNSIEKRLKILEIKQVKSRMEVDQVKVDLIAYVKKEIHLNNERYK